MEDIKKEIADLEKEYKELKEQRYDSETKKQLEKKIWALKHRKFIRTADAIENVGKGFGNLFKRTGKKIAQASKNYEDKLEKERIELKGNSYKQQQDKLSKQVNKKDVEDYMDILP